VKRLAIAGAVAALAIAAIWIWRASRSPAAGGSAEPTDAPGGERSGVARSRGEAPRLDDPAATPGASADQPDDPRAVRRDRGLEPAEVFEAEPRVEPWASAREKGVSRIVGRALGHVSSELSVEAVECRRGTCRVAIDHPEGSDPLGEIPFQVLGPATATAPREDGGGSHLYLFFGPEMRDDATYGDWHRLWRAGRLE
jgi:hypothetical protein